MTTLPFLPGKESEPFMLPHGITVTIREQHGGDDEVLSKMKNVNDGSTIVKFVAGIVTSVDGEKKALTESDIRKWPLRSVYYVLVKSRVFSLGNIISFKHKCSRTSCAKETSYDEDLSIFLAPGGEKKPHEYRDFPAVNFKLSSGKEIEFDILTPEHEKSMLAMPQDSLSLNSKLVVRNLRVKENNGAWTTVRVFNIFTAREMGEIREKVGKSDPEFDLSMDIPCPVCGNLDKVSILAEPNFFFPQGI